MFSYKQELRLKIPFTNIGLYLKTRFKPHLCLRFTLMNSPSHFPAITEQMAMQNITWNTYLTISTTCNRFNKTKKRCPGNIHFSDPLKKEVSENFLSAERVRTKSVRSRHGAGCTGVARTETPDTVS